MSAEGVALTRPHPERSAQAGTTRLPPDWRAELASYRAGRSDVDGLRGPEVNVNHYDGSSYAIHHLDRTQLSGETEDPDHSGASVDEQLSGDCGGFVANYARADLGRTGSEGRQSRTRSRAGHGLLRRA